MDDVLERIQDFFTGDSLTALLIVAGLVVIYLASKLVKLGLKLAVLAVGVALLVGTTAIRWPF